VVKITLCLPVALSACFGSILHTPTLTPSLGGVFCGVLFLACGAAGWNSLQEVSIDLLFCRTRNRPLVTGRLNTGQAGGLSTGFVLLGLAILAAGTEGWVPLFLGIVALVGYNALYTPLKNVSVFALFPGGLVGGLPPLIGWTAAGGGLADSRAWLLLALFFLWQIPHFCLILLRHREEYRAATLPSLIRLFSESSLQRIVVVWICALAVIALALALDRNLLQPGARLAFTLMGVLLPIFFAVHLLRQQPPDYRLLFAVLNGAFFATLLLVAMLQLFAIR
jgi:protoheme IX farnesyltransferase